MPNVTRPTDPNALLANAGNELHWMLRAAAEWERHEAEHLCVAGYEVQVFAMDSAFLHARALFEFFTRPPGGRNYHSVTELGVGPVPSPMYADHWSDPLHDRLAHLQDRNSNPIVPTNGGPTKHIKEIPGDVAAEIRRLWNEMIVALRAGGHAGLASIAEAILTEAEAAVDAIRSGDRSAIYQ